MTDIPEVLFVCTHNAGRSQMAAALLDQRAAGRVLVTSAGSQPADQLNLAVVQAMAEVGLDISRKFPRRLTTDQVRAADIVVTMGCGDACPVYPGRRYLDWDLPDPAGLSVAEVRPIRDDIERRVRALLAELDAQHQAPAATSWAPDACTLPTAERPLRAASFDRLFSGAVLGIERTAPTRLRLDLRPGPKVAAQAAGLAAAETECCSFFTFTLTAASGSLTLDIAAPATQAAVLDALARQAAAAAAEHGPG
jgi:arsenate reductase (thioredoxin)